MTNKTARQKERSLLMGREMMFVSFDLGRVGLRPKAV